MVGARHLGSRAREDTGPLHELHRALPVLGEVLILQRWTENYNRFVDRSPGTWVGREFKWLSFTKPLFPCLQSGANNECPLKRTGVKTDEKVRSTTKHSAWQAVGA